MRLATVIQTHEHAGDFNATDQRLWHGYKATESTRSTGEITHDLAARIDSGGLGARGAGHIDGDEGCPLKQHKAMHDTRSIRVITHDLGFQIHPGGLGARGAGHIDGDEGFLLVTAQSHARYPQHPCNYPRSGLPD